MSTRMLNQILSTLEENGFKASVFANSDGLILASTKTEEMNDKIIAAMVALLSESAEKAKLELELSTDLHEIRIKWGEITIWCRNIVVEESAFLLAGIAPPVATKEEEDYQSSLMDWAVENSVPPLTKLVSL